MTQHLHLSARIRNAYSREFYRITRERRQDFCIKGKENSFVATYKSGLQFFLYKQP